ncbi:hypothetical protein [Francisella sp. SYW-9]|uniref:hypothetical protein n=1 Tax=Francisella sp. SYW-9 TaxID=2610888 RepID=UPI00123DFC61|nr:hypothetical protein [Francisella sp. SYW-9]
MRQKLFPQIFQKKSFFEKLQQTITDNIELVQRGKENLSLALEKCSIEYLIALEHIPLCVELLKAEYVLSFNKEFTLSFLDKDFTELYSCFKEHKYTKLNQVIQFINRSGEVLSQRESQKIHILDRVGLAIKQQASHDQVLNHLDKLQELIDYDQLIIESNIIKEQHLNKTRSIEYYQSCMAILALIKSYNKKIQLHEITKASQLELLNNLDNTLKNSPKMIARLLEPFINKIDYGLRSQISEPKESLQQLLRDANHILYANSFGIKEELKTVRSTNFLLLPLDKLLELKQYLESLSTKDRYVILLKSLDFSIEYCRYKELCINLIEIKKTFNFSDILYSLAELKVNALISTDRSILWEPIVSRLEKEFFVDIKAKKTLAYQDIKILTQDLKIFDLFFRFKLNMVALWNFYKLASDRFFEDVSFNKDQVEPKKYIQILQQQSKKNILQESLNNDNQQELYNKVIDILSELDQFKKIVFRDFENINVDEHLIDFEVNDEQHFLNKKLAYKILYSRYIESDHTKTYQVLYDKWIEVQSIYGEGFVICDLERNVAIIDDLFVQIREKFLTQEIADLCDKTSMEIISLYTECSERNMLHKLSQRINDDTNMLDKLKKLQSKDKFSLEDITLASDFESIVKKSRTRRWQINSEYSDQLSESCKKQNPLFNSATKLEEVSRCLNSLENVPDKKKSVVELTKLINNL